MFKFQVFACNLKLRMKIKFTDQIINIQLAWNLTCAFIDSIKSMQFFFEKKYAIWQLDFQNM